MKLLDRLLLIRRKERSSRNGLIRSGRSAVSGRIESRSRFSVWGVHLRLIYQQAGTYPERLVG